MFHSTASRCWARCRRAGRRDRRAACPTGRTAVKTTSSMRASAARWRSACARPRLARCRRRCAVLELGIARPAEPGLVAGRADPGVQDRVGRPTPPVVVTKMFQPPWAGGSFFARRETTVPQSIDWTSRLRPALRIAWISTWVGRRDGVVVGGVQDGDRLAVVAGLLEQLLAFLGLSSLNQCAAGIGLQGPPQVSRPGRRW